MSERTTSRFLFRALLVVAHLAVVVLVGACQSAASEPTTSPVASATVPAATSSPSPTGPSPTTHAGDSGTEPDAPEPSPGLGVLYGRLVDEAGSPVPRFPVFLAVIWPLTTEEGTSDALLVDTVQAPRAVTDDEGSFVFMDVDPDTYGIHYGYPGDVGAGFMRDAESRDALLYEVRAGLALDVGDVVRRTPSDGGQ